MSLTEQNSIGTKISLLSNSLIRYEGLLCGLDQEDNTVSLSSVRIFGTEGRKGGADEVPPSAQVYELIVFRGRDISDLVVYDNGASVNTPTHIDPAILSVTQGSATVHPPAAAAAVPAKSFVNAVRTVQAPPAAQAAPRGFYDDVNTRQSGAHAGGNGNGNRYGGGGRGGNYNRRGGNYGGGNYGGGRGRGNTHYRRRNQEGHTGQDFSPAQGNQKEKFSEEFDFEKSRQEFEKNKKEFEDAKEDARHHNKVYDKSSFFDNISSDQKDRGATRMDRDEMKKADAETFGQEMVGRMHTGGYRRGGRGGRGRYQRY